jgi:pantoate--beta-alanine ligase
MKVLREISEVREARKQCKSTLGLVPTMGALHEGHLSLIKHSVEKCGETIVSIFVNPTQFGPNEDYEKYPRTVEEDLKKCEEAGASYVFLPTNQTIYGTEKPLVTLNVDKELTSILCGKSRPIHFNGVAQIVSILFNIAQPDVAFFGEKDYQQLTVIRKMVSDLHFPLEIVGVPTVREASGLAKSSRNRYLSESELAVAPNIYKVMNIIKEKADTYHKENKTVSVESLENEAKKMISELVPGSKIDYFEIRSTSDLKRSENLSDDSRIFTAVYVGTTRLIDNLYIGK